MTREERVAERIALLRKIARLARQAQWATTLSERRRRIDEMAAAVEALRNND